MFVRRCAWHRRYHGYVKYLGVSSWRGWGFTFSDGMCMDCAARARAEWSLPAMAAKPAPVLRPGRRFRPDLAFASAVLLMGVTVGFGVLVGPPPRVVSEPTALATDVAVIERSERGPALAAVAPAPSRQTREEHPRVPTVTAPSPVADAPIAARPTRPRPMRVVRAAARRPVVAAYRPAAISVPVEVISAPDVPAEPRATVPALMMPALMPSEVQAP